MNKREFGRRAFLWTAGGAFCSAALRGQSDRGGRPNVIVILADDLGYGDLGCFGSRLPTPNLDQMAQQGIRMTRFYSASPVCSPSRAALLTGRYPARTGVVNVLMPGDRNGLQPTEVTLPKVLREAGYRTSCIGKWHLGNQSQYMPGQHGFDEYFGVPYSNDMSPLPVLRNTQVVLDSCDQESLTDRFTDQAVDFIGRNKERPFFLYLAHTAPHIPIVPAARFRGKSGLGPYGDVVMELDWSVGEVLRAVKANGLDENTLVIFTSDNGPWYQGSAANLQGRKGSTYEGGVREPFIARMPGRIAEGKTGFAVSSTMDLMPTIAKLCGASLPSGLVDGVDIWPVLSGEQETVKRDILLFFDGWNLQCARWGPWKLHLSRYNTAPWSLDPPNGRANLALKQPELYHIDDDPGETYDLATEKPDLVNDLRGRVEEMLKTFPDQVRNAWRDTKSQNVQDTPAGAMPRRNID